MGTIRVNPDALLSDAKKMDKLITSYEKHIKELCEILLNNEAQLDNDTYQAIQPVITSLNNNLTAVKENLKKRSEILKIVANEFSDANNSSSIIATCGYSGNSHGGGGRHV